ncbi:MAG: hypothetical protein WCI45_08895, partial [Desulfuromonadales bacterium]
FRIGKERNQTGMIRREEEQQANACRLYDALISRCSTAAASMGKAGEAESAAGHEQGAVRQ